MAYYVTVGERRVYYQFDRESEMRDTYRYYSGVSPLTCTIDLIHGLDKLIII